MAGRLEGRVAIVTGGGSGIGRHYGLGLAHEGAKVVVADINAEVAESTAREIKEAGGEALAIKVDVSDEADADAMAKAAVDRFGRIDVLVNNAAIYPVMPWEHVTTDIWDRVMAVNLRGLFVCTKAVFPTMKAQGKGKIINISSGTFFGGFPNMLPYVTSKGGVIGFTRALAREVGDHGIRVNAITPGLTQSDGVKRLHEQGILPSEVADQLAQQQSLKRKQEPEDLVGAVLFLASDDSDFITGQTINVDGGWLMH
ncbi:MAG: 3-oxoacyl-ACP reductase FabG [Thermoleophilia bacterium]